MKKYGQADLMIFLVSQYISEQMKTDFMILSDQLTKNQNLNPKTIITRF